MRRSALLLLVSLPSFAAVPLGAQQLPLEQRIEVRFDTAMFTVWSWITLADTATDRTVWPPAKRYVRERLEASLPASYADSLRAAWLTRTDRMFGYHATLLALHLEAPPALDYRPPMLSAYAAGKGDPQYLRFLERLGAPLLPLLREFYRRADVPALLDECRHWYDPAIAEHAAGTLGAVRQALSYLRLDTSALGATDRVVIIPNLLGPPGTAIGPTIGGIQFDVESPRADQPSRQYTAHEFIHAMVAPLTRAEAYRERIEAVVQALPDSIERSEAYRYYPGPVLYFDETLVRAIDFSARLGEALDYDNERLKQSLAQQRQRGFVLVDAMRDALAEFEAGDCSFTEFFEQFLRRLEEPVGAG